MSAAVQRVERLGERSAIITLRAGAGHDAGLQLADALREMVDRGVRRLAVDLRDPAMLNSKVLPAIEATARVLARTRDTKVVVISTRQYVGAMLDASQLDGVLAIVADRAAALTLLASA